MPKKQKWNKTTTKNTLSCIFQSHNNSRNPCLVVAIVVGTTSFPTTILESHFRNGQSRICKQNWKEKTAKKSKIVFHSCWDQYSPLYSLEKLRHHACYRCYLATVIYYENHVTIGTLEGEARSMQWFDTELKQHGERWVTLSLSSCCPILKVSKCKGLKQNCPSFVVSILDTWYLPPSIG